MAEEVIDGEWESDIPESSTDMVGDEQRSSPKRQRTSSTVDPDKLLLIKAMLEGDEVEYDEEKAEEALRKTQGDVAEAMRQLHTLPPKTRGPQENKTQEFIKKFKKIVDNIEKNLELIPSILSITNDEEQFTKLNSLKLHSTSVFNLKFDELSNLLYDNLTIENRDEMSKELNKLHITFYDRYINFINKKLSETAHTDVKYPTALDNLKSKRVLEIPRIVQSSDHIDTLLSNIHNIGDRAQSSHVCEKLLGVKMRGNRSARDEIELNTPGKQAELIAKKLYPGDSSPDDNGHPNIQAIIAAKTLTLSDKIKCCCYGTKLNVDFSASSSIIKNEWEHVCPSLLQSILNGLYTEPNSIPSITMKNVLTQVFPPGHFVHANIDDIVNLCTKAQNMQLLLSIRGFNQAKCSYMLYKIKTISNNINGINCNYINIEVNTHIAQQVYDHMMGIRRSSPCPGSGYRFPVDDISNASNIYTNASGSYPSENGNPTAKLTIEEFTDNLNVVADNYNNLLNGSAIEDINNGIIILACANIYTSFIAYNSKSGRQTYDDCNDDVTKFPVIYKLASLQKNLLDNLNSRQQHDGKVLKGGSNIESINKSIRIYLNHAIKLFDGVESDYDLWGENYDIYNKDAEYGPQTPNDIITELTQLLKRVNHPAAKHTEKSNTYRGSIFNKIDIDESVFSTPSRVPISSYGGKKTKKKNYDRSHIPFMIQELNKLNMKYKKKSKKTKKKKKKKKKKKLSKKKK